MTPPQGMHDKLDDQDYPAYTMGARHNDQPAPSLVIPSMTSATVAVAGCEFDPYSHPAPVLPQHGSTVLPRRFGVPDPEQLGAAAEVLNAAERPAILVGVGALGARYEVSAVAHRLAAPVIKTLPGKAVIPDDVALSVGGLGLLGTRPAEELIDDCDVLLMVGTNFPYTKHLPKPGTVSVVQIDTEPVRLGVRLPVIAPVVGDAAESLMGLLPLGDGGFSMLMAEFLTADPVGADGAGLSRAWSALRPAGGRLRGVGGRVRRLRSQGA